ncbi:MAG: cupin domain-containing protein [Candidatus Methanoperedens sp.]|nr:cupin domain-containing protein [Candidatus Methanoperedens sp.]MCZ7371088.1 cupin domain-containing protein [Candidatus Methanoperedens sp.]
MFLKQIENGLDLTDEARNIAAVYDTSLQPGETIPVHYHPGLEEIYYILSGYGAITIGEETREISRNDVVYIQPLAPHTLLNTGKVPLRFLTVSVRIVENKEDMPYTA